MVLWSVTLKIGALTKLGLFFPVVCLIYVFDQILAEQLYHDKDLLHFTVEKSTDINKLEWLLPKTQHQHDSFV